MESIFGRQLRADKDSTGAVYAYYVGEDPERYGVVDFDDEEIGKHRKRSHLELILLRYSLDFTSTTMMWLKLLNTKAESARGGMKSLT